MSSSGERPDPDLPQDPGIPGFDAPSDAEDTGEEVEKDAAAEERERPDEADLEGHMTAPSGDSESGTPEP